MRVMPRNFAPKHAKRLVEHWLVQGLEAGTIQQYFSYIRTFCRWIGKSRMVPELEQLVPDSARVKRVYAAKEDKSWRSHGVDAAEKIAQAAAICAYVGMQLEMKVAYALRPKEAMMIRPHEAERNGCMAVTTVEDPKRYAELIAQLEVKRGTKGGRMRLVPIDTPEKRGARESEAPGPEKHTSRRPGPLTRLEPPALLYRVRQGRAHAQAVGRDALRRPPSIRR